MVRRASGHSRGRVGLLLVLVAVMVLAAAGVVGLAESAEAQEQTCAPLPPGASGLVVPGSAIFPLITWDTASYGYVGFHWGQFPLMVPPGYSVSIQVNLMDDCYCWPACGHYNIYRTESPDPAALSYYVPPRVPECNSYGWRITSVNVCAAPPQGTIVVRTVGGPDPVTFTKSGGWSGTFEVTPGTDWSSGPLLVGTYGITEVVPEGWSLLGASCDDGQDPAAILLKKDRTVTCTFTNTDQGRIIVRKVGGPGPVTFTQSGDWEGSFQMFPGTDWDSGLIPAGTYGIAEIVPEGWTQVKAICDGGRDPASFALGEAETVVCTFTNTRGLPPIGAEEEGSLTIIKRTVPAGGTGFDFDAGPLGSFSLDDGGTQTILDLAAGTYTVTETPAEDWEFAQVECDAQDWTADGATVTVNLAEEEAAVCTFTNGQLPYTGTTTWLLPLLLAGLATMLTGLGVWARSWMREAERT